MALITRITRLFRADLHAVLDRLEEPDVLLKQAVREMEEALSNDERRLKALTLERDQRLAREADLQQSLGSLGEELDLCFAAEKDDLARALIRRQLESERLAKALGRQRATLEQGLATLEVQVVANRARLEAMRQQAALMATDEERSRPEEVWSATPLGVCDEEVEVALLRERQKRRRP